MNVGVRGQGAVKHARVKFQRPAIDIDKGTRKCRAQQGGAQFGRTGKQLIDKGILRRAQRKRINARNLDQFLRIMAPGMGRCKHHRQGLPGWQDDGCRSIAGKIRWQLVHCRLLCLP